MLEKRKILDSQFLLTSEQKVALVEAKIARAEAYIKSLAEQAQLLEKARARR